MAARWWVHGHHEEADVWQPLYGFPAHERHRARATLVLLLTMENDGTKLWTEHAQFDDFRLVPPDEDSVES